MKKFYLAVFVVVCFFLYNRLERHGSGSVIKPPSLNQSSPSASTSSNGGSSGNSGSASSTPTAMTYKDGQYTGDVADAFYGNVQIKATIQSGKVTNVQFLQYPNDRANSIRINQQAMPYLIQEALQAQSAHVDIVSGATDTSGAFIESLTSALSQAQS